MASSTREDYPDYAAPSYEESVSSPQPLFSTQDAKGSLPLSSAPPPSLQSHLTETRTQRISAILSTYVDPLLIAQGAAGLYKTTFLLVASNDPSLQPPSNSYSTPKEPEVIGFPSDEIVKLVQLKGEENTLAFWRQPAVVAELESALKARLVASGHRLEQSYGEPVAETSQPSPQETHDVRKKSEGRSFWGRNKDKLDNPPQAIVVDRKLGWRADEPRPDDSPKSKVPTGLVRAMVRWKPVSTRVENEMGLYETKNGTGLCISIEVGS